MFRLWSRWDAFSKLGDAMTRLAERAEIRRIAEEDADRASRLGDIDGQTMRAVAFADSLAASVLVDVVDPATSKPAVWPR